MTLRWRKSRQRMKACDNPRFCIARTKRSALRTPASQRSCPEATSALRASTMSRQASNAAEVLGRDMRPTVHASICRLRVFSSTSASHRLNAAYARRFSMRDTTSCTRALSSRHTRTLMRHWKNASAMLCCFHRRMNRSARFTLASYRTCACSASRATLRFASTSSTHSRNADAQAFRVIFWMHRATLTLSVRSLRAASRQRWKARNSSRCRRAPMN